MRSLIRRRPVVSFMLLVYALAVAVFAIPLLSDAGIGVIPLELPGVAPFILAAALGLLGTAFFVTSVADGRPGVQEFRRRVFRFGVNPLWFLLALLLLPVTAVITASLVTGDNLIAGLASRPELALAMIVEAAIAFVLVNWWEEAAITGFVIERLQPRMGPIWASVVSTWIQAGVHVPLVFVAGGVTVGRVPTAQIPLFMVALFVLPIPVRMMITYLYNSTSKSIPVVGLFHASMGVATGSAFMPEIAPDFNQIWVYAGFAVVATMVLVLTNGRLGYTPVVAQATETPLESRGTQRVPNEVESRAHE